MREEFLYQSTQFRTAENAKPGSRIKKGPSGFGAYALASALFKSKSIKALTAALAVLAVLFAGLLFIYKDIKPFYTSELGDALPPANVFLKASAGSASYTGDLSGIDIHKEETYIVKISHGNTVRYAVLMVRDTIAPYAESDEFNITIDDSLSITDIVHNITDKSRVFASWISKPKFGTAGKYTAKIKLRDEYGNKNIVSADINIRAVVDEIEYEAGSEFPDISKIVLVQRGDACFMHKPTDTELKTPGTYKLITKIDGKKYSTAFRVKDTVEPKLELKTLVVSPGEEPDFAGLIEKAEDATELKYEYKTDVDVNKPGVYPVKVTVTDKGYNSVSAEGNIAVAPNLELEARTEPLTAEEAASAFNVGADRVSFTESMIPNKVGANLCELNVSGEKAILAVTVKDTVAPRAEAAPVESYTRYPLEAKSFVSDIIDATDVEVSFVSEPDFDLEGSQNVDLLLKDAGGNELRLSTTLTLIPDTEPPVLYNVRDRFAYVDGNVFYLEDILAEDNADKDVQIEVQKPFVNPHEEGQYSVTYIASDKAGNKTEKTCIFTFIPQVVSDEKLEALRNEIYAKIFTEGMTPAQQARAIFDYLYSHIVYNNSSDKRDWKAEAYRGLTQGKGDCFTFYSASYLLLSGIDCELMSVRRIGGSSEHFWCYVNLGNGWYHFDTCNVGAGAGGYCFMRTTDEINFRGPYYWHFDESLLPVSASTPFAQTELGK